MDKINETYKRPWGSYVVLSRGPGFQVKRLTVLPERRLSLQWHRHRDEIWTIARGTGEAFVDGKTISLGRGQTLTVPRTQQHRVTNISSVDPLEIVEVQTGDYLGEDDIVRVEDDFGRVDGGEGA